MFKQDCDIFTFFYFVISYYKGGCMFKRLFEYKPPYALGGGGLTEKKTNHNQVQHLY